ncbi:ABC transporter permease [Spirochaeta cellobiosiphila]|uniref:ABC transporter permease n=1 Tax=Spirochaeta cellobiosiphila TaxID=504483 RepID=UPI000411B59D|nr:ABC transporter permease [Spirochaeta cellobiosiphila]
MLWKTIVILYERWDFFSQLLIEHLRICALAILFASLLGLFLGIIITEYQKLYRIVTSISNVVYTIPSISMLGFLLPFTGIGDTTAIIALSLYGLLPIVGNTATGIRNIDPKIIEAAKGMGSSRWNILVHIKLPLALPVIMTGLRTMVVMTIALAGIASFIGAGGLGVAIYRGITTNNMAVTLGGSLLIALMAILMDLILHLLQSRIPWKEQ